MPALQPNIAFPHNTVPIYPTPSADPAVGAANIAETEENFLIPVYQEASPSSSDVSDPFTHLQHPVRSRLRGWPKMVSSFKKFLSFCGPGYMIAVGYMDPGNWATDLEAGSQFGYSLLFVILMSNMMAMLLQHLCVRLGVTARLDLAEACRKNCGRCLNLFLYVLAEIAIISCDLAEVVGTAIALKLLFGLPIIWGVLVTAADVLLLLAGISAENGGRSEKILEIVVMLLMTVIGACFTVELFIVKPVWKEVMLGFIPRDPRLFTNRDALFCALGILGATVMPHNLYLHSSIVKHRMAQKTRQVESADKLVAPTTVTEDDIESTVKYATADSMFALFLALFINSAILIVSAAAFNSRGIENVNSIEDASLLMRKWLGPAASILFGLALLAAGQSSTVTGTVAGQIVFEGFLLLQMKPWMRRLVTRVVAIVPAVVIVMVAGADSINQILLYSQVILSFQLPFAIIPLIIYSLRRPTECTRQVEAFYAKREGTLTERLLKASAWAVAIAIIALNVVFMATLVI